MCADFRLQTFSFERRTKTCIHVYIRTDMITHRIANAHLTATHFIIALCNLIVSGPIFAVFHCCILSYVEKESEQLRFDTC